MHTGITCGIIVSRQSYHHTPRFHFSIELINLWVRVSQYVIDINLPFLMADRVFTMSPQMDVSVGKCRVTIPIKYLNNNDEQCDPVPFFRLAKSDCKIGKLLTATIPADKLTKARPLSQTNIIEKCVAARDAKFVDMLEIDKDGKRQKRYTGKQLRHKVLALPDIMKIEIPPLCEFDAFEMSAMTSKPTSELWIELSEENLKYLSDVVAKQLEEGSVERIHPRLAREPDERVDLGVHGASFDYSTDRVRVRWTESGGRKRSRLLPASVCIEDAKDQARICTQSVGETTP